MSRRFNRFLAVAMVTTCLLVLLPACSSDDTTTPEPAIPAQVSGTIGTGGGTLTSSDNRLSITIPAGALTADTEIVVTEMDTPPTDLRLGPFVAQAGLTFEPAGLHLLQSAEVSFELPLSNTSSKASPLKTGTEGEFDLLIGLLLDDDSSSMPEQELEIDLRDFRKQIFVHIDKLDPMVLGSPVAPDNPQQGSVMSELQIQYGLPEGGIILGDVLEAEIEIDSAGPDFWTYHSYGFDMTQPPLEYVYEPVEPVIEDLDLGRIGFTFFPHYASTDFGDLDLNIDFHFNLSFTDPDVLDLPDDFELPLYDVYFKIKSPTFSIDVAECADPPCIGFDGTFQTNMTALEGMASRYTLSDAEEVNPDGEDEPWLYVAGSDGVQYWTLARDVSGTITGATKRGEVLSLFSRGAVPVEHTPENRSAVRVLLSHGFTGAFRNHWNPDPAVNDYGAGAVVAGRVTDAESYGSKDYTNGFCWVGNGAVHFQEYDQGSGLFLEPLDSALLSGLAFIDMIGSPYTAVVDPYSGAALVGMDGSPGQLWYHDRDDVHEVGSLVAIVGNGVRQIRGDTGLYGVLNSDSNSISIITWFGLPVVHNHGQASVGTAPESLDVIPLNETSAAMVSASATDNTYTILVVDFSGEVLSNTTFDIPAGCPGAKHAIFVPGPKVYVALSCGDSGIVTLVETTLVQDLDGKQPRTNYR
ncbi:MAG: hypothetical protein GY780_04945 [bacterium]|nr:hypothetical protein [bacterium]